LRVINLMYDRLKGPKIRFINITNVLRGACSADYMIIIEFTNYHALFGLLKVLI